jgi:hypothetical protein
MEEERILKTNAGVKTGRPQTGFESWRNNILNAELVSFEEYVYDCIEEIKTIGGKIEYGNKVNDTFIRSQKGQVYSVVKVTFPEQDSKYRSVKSFKEDWDKYKKEFEAKKARVRGIKPDSESSFLEGVFL